MQLVIALLAVLLGVLFAFGGWRFFLILLPFWGLFMGFNIGTEATRALLGDGTFATLTSWAIGIVLAIVFAALCYLYWYGAIALLAGTVGYILGASAWGLIGSEQGVLAFVIGIALGAIFAIGALVLNVPKWLVVAFTSIGGAALIVAAWFILTGAIPVGRHHLERDRQGDQRELHLARRLARARGGRVLRPDACPGHRPGHVRVRPVLVPVRREHHRLTYR